MLQVAGGGAGDGAVPFVLAPRVCRVPSPQGDPGTAAWRFSGFCVVFWFCFCWCCGQETRSGRILPSPSAAAPRWARPRPVAGGLGGLGWVGAGAGRQVQAGPAPAATARPRAGLVGRRLLQPGAEVSK